jgi:hypothetical protein
MKRAAWCWVFVTLVSIWLVTLSVTASGVAGKPGTEGAMLPPKGVAQETIYNSRPGAPEVPPVCPPGVVADVPQLLAPDSSRILMQSGPTQSGGPQDPRESQAPGTEAVSAVVLWDQPSNAYTGIIDQYFPDFGAGVYSADDFIAAAPWRISKIFVSGVTTGSGYLNNAVSLNWAIYANAGGLPAGYPGAGATPLWSLSLPPTAPGVTLSGGNLEATLDIAAAGALPITLPAGTYWLEFYPSLNFSPFGQWFWYTSGTANGSIAQVVDPTNLLGAGWTSWVPWTNVTGGVHDAAFRLEGDICVGGSYGGIFTSGPLVTHPGGGSGGADASAVQTGLGMGTYGFGDQYAYGYRMADDFVVFGVGADINSIQFYAYQTGSTTTSTITGVFYQIWNGPPNNPASAVVFGDLTTNRLISSTWSNIYRVLDTALTGNTRPIMVNTVSCGASLAPGTYWLDWMTDGTLGSGPWAPPISILGTTTTGNALQWTGAWAAAIDTGSGTQQGMPFKLFWSECINCPTITLSPVPLPVPIQGVPYSQTITASGGTGPYTYAVTAGTLPTGLTLSAAGVLSGTMTAIAPASFTVTATDTSSSCTGSQAYSVSTYSAFFKDDMGRSLMCVNRLTGAYTYQILTAPGVGIYTGTCVVMNGGAKYVNQAGAPDRMNVTYDPVRRKASGYFITAAGACSALSDANTANNAGGCP